MLSGNVHMLDKTGLSQREDLDITNEYSFSPLYVWTIVLNFISVQRNIDRLPKNMISFQYVLAHVGHYFCNNEVTHFTANWFHACMDRHRSQQVSSFK